MSDDKQRPSEQKPQPDHSPTDVFEQAKRALIYGTGYKRPPEQNRFKKGQSGNPKGRPKSSAAASPDSLSANALALRESGRLIKVREGDEVRELSAIEAVFRAQYASALKGSPYSLRSSIDRYDRAERERRQQIADEIELWKQYVELKRWEIADAESKGDPAPEPLPHPDDVVLDREKGVRFSGPFTEWEFERLQDTLRLRNILIMQEALDQRSPTAIELDDPLDQFGSAMSFACYFNENVPDRFKLGQTEILLRFDKFMMTPKRILLKDLYRTWREYGRSFPRGFTFPPLRFATTMFETLPEFVKLLQKAANGECAPGEYEERAIEFISRVRGAALPDIEKPN